MKAALQYSAPVDNIAGMLVAAVVFAVVAADVFVVTVVSLLMSGATTNGTSTQRTA